MPFLTISLLFLSTSFLTVSSFLAGGFVTGGGVVFIFFLVGEGTALKNKDFSPILMWIVVFGTARFFLTWTAFRVSRYTLPLYPGILMFSASGAFKSLYFLKNRLPKRTMSISIIFSAIILYIFAVYSIRGYAVTDINSQTFVGYKQAGAFLMTQDSNLAILTPSPRQIKYYAPKFNVYDLEQNFTVADVERLIKDKKIHLVSIDKWSPHQPAWCKNYSWAAHGYRLVYDSKNIVIFKVRG